MGNTLALIALLVWPAVAVYLFRTMERRKAIVWLMLIPFLYMPSAYGFDIVGLPPLSKDTLPTLVLVLLLLAVAGKELIAGARHELFRIVVACMLAGLVITAALNGDTIINGATTQRGLSLYLGFTAAMERGLSLAPFAIGYAFLYRADDHRLILGAILVAGLIYSIGVAYEVRMAPVLHGMFYGYFPHSFVQHVREGGWRPVVFQPHGLWLSFFMAVALCAAAAVWKDGKDRPLSDPIERRFSQFGVFIVIYLAVMLALCRSLAALVYGLVFLALIVSLGPVGVARAALALTAAALLYPFMRIFGLFPTDTLLDLAYSVSQNRGWSLQFRFNHEEDLIARAMERPIFGWGGWGRYRIMNEFGGGSQSVVDGAWIYHLGSAGLVGVVSFFAALALPVIMLASRLKRLDIGYATAALALIIAISMVELLPNSTLFPWLWLICGSVFGYAVKCAAPVEGRAPVEEPVEADEARVERPRRPRTVL